MNKLSPPEQFNDSAIEEMLTFLDDLRESGATNMFGAASWLENDFGISKSEAKQVLAYWMDSFSQRQGAEEA